MNAMDISNRVVDPTWQGLDGKGHPDLSCTLVFTYYMEALITFKALSTLHLTQKTMTLDNTTNVHASWSFPQMPEQRQWHQNLKVIDTQFNGGN
jgi:CO dehydrogenase/acetyl-CoA synthase epsilon subunit